MVDAVVDVVVDAANVVGSRPDGWWRDRAGAAQRLLARLAALPGALVPVATAGSPPGGSSRVRRVHVVLEGAAKAARTPQGCGAPADLVVVRAEADGDGAIAELAGALATAAAGEGGARAGLVVVTADRGLRARLPAAATAVGPRWLLAELDRLDRLDPPAE